jgi:hypothetical protein
MRLASQRVTAVVTAGAGFLLAVLWFDLMFDVQALRAYGGDLPEPILASIAGYYARVSIAARPMNRLVALVMLATIAALLVQAPRWEAWASLVPAAAAISLAAVHTVPAAQRLGTRRDPLAVQSHLARAIARDHVVCLALIAVVLVLQLGFAR